MFLVQMIIGFACTCLFRYFNEIGNFDGLFAHLDLLFNVLLRCIPMSTLSEQGTDIESATRG